ncbi:MAG: methionine biosynthesis protein MetW [Deltaproteobacteria bacterium]|nr:methionine biosynthesis protein MetW [Deltaproteobacteria bacterium]
MSPEGNPARADHRQIVRLVERRAKVLDLGCGDGDLLALLAREREATGFGVEISAAAVRTCLERGLGAVQGDVAETVAEYPDGSFDTVILSHTLQELADPARVLDDMLRVGRDAIVSFPNFGHVAIRLSYVLRGRMPKSRVLPFEWYNTPNVHLMTVLDFEQFCAGRGIEILDRVYLGGPFGRVPAALANLLAETAVFRLRRHRARGSYS